MQSHYDLPHVTSSHILSFSLYSIVEFADMAREFVASGEGALALLLSALSIPFMTSPHWLEWEVKRCDRLVDCESVT